MATLEQQVKGLIEEKENNIEWHRRIEDDIKKMNEKIDVKLDTITEILVELKHLRADHNDLKGLVEKHNSIPSNNYNALKMALATTLLGAIIGFLVKVMLS